MKVTVTKKLNVRVGQPSVNAPSYQYLAPGSELEVEEQVYKGGIYDGDDRWLRDKANNYYWVGGTNYDAQTSADKSNLSDNHIAYLRLNEIWKRATGKGVGVAVVDTGIDHNNPDLVFNRERFFSYEGAADLIDRGGHGSHCAGLIASRNTSGRQIGVAPACNLFVCKISDKSYLARDEYNRYAEAIEWCAKQADIHVISISWGSFIYPKETKQRIQQAIDAAIQANKVVVCAIGDASSFPDNSKLIPATMNGTIAVGSIPVKDELYPYVNEHLTVSTKGYKIESYNQEGTVVAMNGTSQSNAMVAGVIALMIEQSNFQYTPDQIKEQLATLTSVYLYQNVHLKLLDPELLNNYFQPK
jgi:subtilisin family serine protease